MSKWRLALAAEADLTRGAALGNPRTVSLERDTAFPEHQAAVTPKVFAMWVGELWIHAGGPKTGTSAIQSAAVVGRDRLLAQGLFYPSAKTDDAARRGEVTSGNGASFAAYVTGGQVAVDRAKEIRRIQKMLQDARSEGHHRLLISSELMADPDPERLTHLMSLIGNLGWHVRVVYCVRHIIDQAISIFGQQTKRGDLLNPKAFFQDFRSPTFGLETYAALLSSSDLIVRSYDLDAPALVQNFFGSIGINHAATASTVMINRSASRSELASIREAARIIEPKQSRALTNVFRDSVHLLLAETASDMDDAIIEVDEAHYVEANHDGLVHRVDNAYFSGENILQLKSEKVCIRDRGVEPKFDPVLVNRLIAFVESGLARSAKE